MRKYFGAIAALVLAAALFTGCRGKNVSDDKNGMITDPVGTTETGMTMPSTDTAPIATTDPMITPDPSASSDATIRPGNGDPTGITGNTESTDTTDAQDRNHNGSMANE